MNDQSVKNVISQSDEKRAAWVEPVIEVKETAAAEISLAGPGSADFSLYS